MRNLNPKIILLGIVLLSAVLRLINVPSVPPALSWDEVSLGYNAYSILKTGRDEHGKFMPIRAFESYGDYKPPFYIYADVPFVALFGLTEFAVRMPSILAGIISVALTYFIVKEIFWKKKERWVESTALLSALFLAISPWHLNISRAGYEANVAHAIILAAILFLLKAIHGKTKYLFPASVLFVLSLYTFNSARIFVPVFGLGILTLFYKQIWAMKKAVLASALLGLIMLLPLIPHVFSQEGKLRFQEVNIFSDMRPVITANERIEASGDSWWANIIHNRRVQFAREMARHYLDNVSMNFLFINGDGNPKFSIRDVGQLYIWDLPFMVLGIYFLIKRKTGEWKVPFLWLLVGILPASIARETPHALRTLATLPVWQLFIAVGVVESYRIINGIKYSRGIAVILITALIVNALYYLHNYHIQYPKEYASEWQYGYQHAVARAMELDSEYDKIWVTNSIGRPYMYTLFYTQYDPEKFQTEAVRTSDAYGFFEVHSFGKYNFDPLLEKFEEKTLYIEDPAKVPEDANVVDTISLPNGKPALVLYE